MDACHLLIYSIMGISIASSSATTTGGYDHSLLAPHVTVTPAIRLAAQWRNPYRAFSIDPLTTQLSLPYSSTNLATALYIIPQDRTVAPIFTSRNCVHSVICNQLGIPLVLVLLIFIVWFAPGFIWQNFSKNWIVLLILCGPTRDRSEIFGIFSPSIRSSKLFLLVDILTSPKNIFLYEYKNASICGFIKLI